MGQSDGAIAELHCNVTFIIRKKIMSKLMSLNEIELETLVNPADSAECKFSQKSQKYWSMLIIKKNLWINYLTREHLLEFKSNPSKRWKVIELKAKNDATYYWLEGLEKSYEIKEEV